MTDAASPARGNRSSSIGRASALLASGTLVSRLLGFVKAIILTATLGQISVGGNAFANANQLPNTVYAIIAGGVLGAILVPQIVRATLHADRGHAYINKLLTIAIVVLAGATVVATFAAPVLVRLVAATLPPDQMALTIALAYWCIPQLFFYGLYTVLGEILNAHKIFGPFTWSPVLNNVVAIAGLVVFQVIYGAEAVSPREAGDFTPDMIAVLGGSATVGVAVQAVILFVFWRRVGLHFRPDFHWRGVGLRATGRLAGWTFAMIIATQLAGLVQSQTANVASGQGPSVLALQNAWLIFMLPHSVITVSLTTAYFTQMSEHARERDFVALRSDVSTSIRQVSLLIVLAAAGLIVCSYPFASLFSSSYAETVDFALLIVGYVLGLVPFCILFVVQRAFYALGDTRTPFFFTVFQVVLFSVLASVALLLPPDVIAFWLTLTSTVAGTLQMFLAFFLLRQRLNGLDVQHVVNSVLLFSFSAVPAAVAGGVVGIVLGIDSPDGFAVGSAFGALVSMGVIGAVMTLVYVLFLAIFRVPELRQALRPVLRRLGR